MQKQRALIVVDVQNGFTPGGCLAVAGADQIIPLINQLGKKFSHVVLTQDWHPHDHISFVENHAGCLPYQSIELDYGTQVLWPSHCVQGSVDAQLHPNLALEHAQLIIRKGFHQHIDSYSAFQEADRQTKTGLTGYLTERGITELYIVGIATDFCVAWTAIDACEFGFSTFVIEDACQAIDLNGSLAQAWQQMQQAGVTRVQSRELL